MDVMQLMLEKFQFFQVIMFEQEVHFCDKFSAKIA